MKKTKINPPLFPFFFTITNVLYFYFSHPYDSTLDGVMLNAFFSIIILSILWSLFFLITKDINSSAFITIISIVLIFNFQYIMKIISIYSVKLKIFTLKDLWLSTSGQLMGTFIILFIILLVSYYYYKKPRINPRVNLYLNSFFAFFLIFIIAAGVKDMYLREKQNQKFTQYWTEKTDTFSSEFPTDTRSLKPDIYYIILDGYARSDTLSKIFGIEDSLFMDALKNRGVYIATESNANYSQTRTSLASSLNMTYLDDVSKIVEDKSNDHPSYYMIDNNLIKLLLKSYNYKTVSFQSDATFTDFSDLNTVYNPKNTLNFYTATYLNSTVLSVIVNPLMYTWHRSRVNYVFDALPKVGQDDEPEFFFIHILCPHPPFVFYADGTTRNVDRLYTVMDASHFFTQGTKEEYQDGYKQQVIYLQTKITTLVDELIKTSEDPFILVFQGDHGSGMYFNHDDLEKSIIEERMGIFNAIFFYDQDYRNLYPEISPVNTFRVIFSQYFGVELPLLEDRHYYSTFLNLFDFTQVDHMLNK